MLICGAIKPDQAHRRQRRLAIGHGLCSDSTASRCSNRLNRSARQTFSAGWCESTTALKPDDMPTGVFLSAIAHPIFKVTQVQYPAKDPISVLTGIFRMEGVLVFANFKHLPNMGECYFYIASCLATKAA